MSSESNEDYLHEVQREIRAQAERLAQRPLLPRRPPSACADGAERARRDYRIGELTDPHYLAFVEHAFRALLKRAPTPAETEAQLRLLGAGAAKAEILGNLRWSAEGRRIGTRVAGLLPRYALAKAARVPLLGYLVQWGLALAGLPLLVRHQRAIDTLAAAARHAALESEHTLGARLDMLATTQGARLDALAATQNQLREHLADMQRRTDAIVDTMHAIEASLRTRIEALELTAGAQRERLEELEFLRARVYAINHWSHQLTQAFAQIEETARERRQAHATLAATAAQAVIEADTARSRRNGEWADRFARELPADARVLLLASGRDWGDLLAARGLRWSGAGEQAADASRPSASDGESVPPRELLRCCEDRSVEGLTVLALPLLARTLPLVELLGEAARVLRPGGRLLLAYARESDALVDALLAGEARAPDIELLTQALIAAGFGSVARVDAADGTPALLAQRAPS